MADYMNSDFYNPNRGFRVWYIDEIVLVAGQTNKYVVNVNDMVIDYSRGQLRVTDVEQGTWVPTLELIEWPAHPDPDGEENVLVGVGPGYSSESYRCFIDTSVTPYVLAPDARLHFYGSMVSSYAVFKGSDINKATGKMISAFYDSSGTFLGPYIPVESAEITGAKVSTIKIPMVGFATEDLEDSERVTLVAYDDKEGVISYAQLLVMNTEVLRQTDQSKRYVEGIKLDSPFISTSDPKVIEFPLNVMVKSLPMQGIVKYRGGRQTRYDVGPAPFTILGLENYVATGEGQEFPLAARYQLANDEISYQLVPSADRAITENYIARTVAADGAYSCRLFVYPTWVNAAIGYRLEFWLYNLDRARFYNVTPYVELGVNSAPYRPRAYGEVQTLTYAVNLNEVDGRFAPFRYVSTFQIALLNAGPDQANWAVYPRPDVDASYGRGLKADLEYVATNTWNLRLQNGANSLTAWLQQMYYNAEPLVNTELEEFPPEPTHFILHFLHGDYKFSVQQWNQVLTVNNDLNMGELLSIQWIKEMYDTDLQLAMTGVPIFVRSGP
ncbi:virion structural protein [Pseudomonas phage 201phi2-1]|uniref:Virion structural protein n=1 Tax=Pseudomonas phage 201phi2-1 TaxID=198110 RepID=B3FK03_BP201|nr:virion structural protein [Pseudomonas phage 201phi2-1]ABY62861.1 virion structural protein [Pseudomonas phage 201phi2-1]